MVLSSDSEGYTDEEHEATDLEYTEYDEFGFPVQPVGKDTSATTTRTYAEWFRPKAERRLRRFEARRKRLSAPGQWTTVPTKTMKALLRKGIPPEHRSEVWWNVLGCDVRQQSAPDYYKKHVGEDLVAKTVEEIERDLPRTFPNNRTFCTEAGRGQLRNVLHAYACHAPKVRYCQGLNIIAAMLLLVFLDEERAFWALVCAIERLGVEGYYVEGMALLRADMLVLFTVMAKKCPKVAKRFRDANVDVMTICSGWYLTWFAKCLPIATILRVWDTLFFEGYKVLFRVTMGVFKRAEREVLQCQNFETIMESAKLWPGNMVQHNELIKASFAGIPQLRRRDLVKARDQALGAVEREDEANRRRIQESRARDEERRRAAAAAQAAAGESSATGGSAGGPKAARVGSAGA